jgi:hemolysin III
MAKKKNKAKYTLGEEITNSITHGIGVIFGITILVLTIIIAAKNKNTAGIVASCIYASSMIIMFLMSCLYHALSPNLKAKKVLRVIDHCDIYAFIAGSYTPFCISLIGGLEGWRLFGIIWSCAILGIIINAINIEKFKKLSLALYLIMGWMIIISFNSLYNAIQTPGLILLLTGGIIYTIGAILYVIGHKIKYMHSVFHIFVLAGCILQSFSIIFYAI